MVRKPLEHKVYQTCPARRKNLIQKHQNQKLTY